MPGFTLAYTPPLDWPALAGFLASRGAAGVEQWDGEHYARNLEVDGCRGWVRVSAMADKPALQVRCSPGLAPVQAPLKQHLRRLFDLDAQPQAIRAQLGRDPLLGELIRRRPGVRVPGALDGFELALRAVLGQQISVRAATTVFARFAQRFGERLDEDGAAGAGCLAPTATAVAAASHAELIALGLTGRRAATVQALAHAVAVDGLRLEAGVDLARTREQLIALPGIGPWTASYVAMRALRDADALPEADLGLMKGVAATRPRELLQRAEAWRPWRAYAAMLLWTALSAGG